MLRPQREHVLSEDADAFSFMCNQGDLPGQCLYTRAIQFFGGLYQTRFAAEKFLQSSI